jgi:hypothetical protein
MVKKLGIVLMAASLAVPLVPSAAMSWHGGPPPRHHHGHHGGDAWLWGLGGLVLGTAIVATALQPPPPPPPQHVVYVDPQPVGYAYQPRVAPEMCRWERYVLDGYGRTVFDRYGRPVKEYTTGPCDYPPAR